MGKRRKAREIALQGLYQLDVGNQNLIDVLSFSWLNTKPDEDILKFAEYLIRKTYKNIEQIDKYIKENSQNWDFSRIDSLEKNILRFSTYSMVYQKDIPASVVINEAVDISKKYCSDDSYKFINGILDGISKNSGNPHENNDSFIIRASKPIAFAMIIISIGIILYLLIFKPEYDPEKRLYPKNTTTPGVLELRLRLNRKIKHPEIKKGHRLFMQKRYKEAQKLFKGLLNIIHDKQRKFLYFYLGEIQYVKQNYKFASDLYNSALDIDKNFFECLVKRGMASSKLNNHERALHFLKRARSINPKSFYANFELGKVFVRIKRFKRALAFFNYSLDIVNDIRAYFYKGLCLFKSGEKQKSVKIFHTIATTETEVKFRRAAIVMLTKYYYEKDDYAKVAGLLMSWKSIEPQNEKIYFELGKVFYLMKKYRQSYNYFQDAFERNPGNTKFLIYLAMTEVALKKYQSAIIHIRRYLKTGKTNYRAYRIAGDSYFGLLEYKRSLKNYMLYFKNVPDEKIDNQIFFRIAKIYDALGKYDKSIRYLNKLEKMPGIEKEDIYYNLAVVYDHKQDYENAVHYLFKTLKISYEKEKIRSYIGDIYLKMKRFNQAIDFYKRVLKMSPESQVAAYKLGNAYFSSGDFNTSRSYFQRIITHKEKPGQKKNITSLAFMRLGDIEQIEQNYLKATAYYEKKRRI